MLAHYYTDVSDPFHTDNWRGEMDTHRRFDRQVTRLVNQDGGDRARRLVGAVSAAAADDDVAAFTRRSAARAHRDYAPLMRAMRQHRFGALPQRAARDSLRRAVQGLANIIVAAASDAPLGATAPVSVTSAPPALLSQGRPVATSSENTVYRPARCANDGDGRSWWAADVAGYPQWWQVDLGADYDLSSLKVDWLKAKTRSYTYTVQVSGDGSTWTPAVDQSARLALGDSSDSLSGKTGRYVRIQVLGYGVSGKAASDSPSKSNAAMVEFGVYGMSTGEPTPTPTPTATPTPTPTRPRHLRPHPRRPRHLRPRPPRLRRPRRPRPQVRRSQWQAPPRTASKPRSPKHSRVTRSISRRERILTGHLPSRTASMSGAQGSTRRAWTSRSRSEATPSSGALHLRTAFGSAAPGPRATGGGAHDTTFRWVRFRGGKSGSVVFLGRYDRYTKTSWPLASSISNGVETKYDPADRSAHNILFQDCEFERPQYSNADYLLGGGNDTVSIWGNNLAGETNIHHIAFDRCHFGVKNGAAGTEGYGTGRVAVIIQSVPHEYSWRPDHPLDYFLTDWTLFVQNQHDFSFTNSVFEQSFWVTANPCDHARAWGVAHGYTTGNMPAGAAPDVTYLQNVVFDGNTFKGSGLRTAQSSNPVRFEVAKNSIVKNSTIYLGNASSPVSMPGGGDNVTAVNNVVYPGFGAYTPSPYDP